MYKNILYPTDGSTGADAVLEHCRTLAETYGATIHVLYVAEQQPYGLADDLPVKSPGGMVGDPKGGGSSMAMIRKKSAEVLESVRDYGTSIVNKIADQLGNGKVKTAVKQGNPFKVILSYVDDHDIDLIVMGTHGRTGLDRYLIGSVTEKVVRMSDVPVMTVRRNDE